MVKDLGFQQSAVDKIVDFTKGIMADEGVTLPNHAQQASSAIAQGSTLLGSETWHTLRYKVSLNFTIMVPLWLAEVMHLPDFILSKLLLLRLVRLRFLLRYFNEVRLCQHRRCTAMLSPLQSAIHRLCRCEHDCFSFHSAAGYNR